MPRPRWCWTKINGRRKEIGFVRYITFAIAFIFVAVLFLSHTRNLEKIMFIAFIVGNILYYAIGIILAFLWKDNRAFCKYICPVTVFLKPMSYFSVFRVKCDKEKCISCMHCVAVCPQKARHCNKVMELIASKKMKTSCSARKENKLYL